MTPGQIVYFFQKDSMVQANPSRAEVYEQTWRLIEAQQQRIAELELQVRSVALSRDELAATVERLRDLLTCAYEQSE